jgi:uncharacterized coiled-coil DUF342 family protein
MKIRGREVPVEGFVKENWKWLLILAGIGLVIVLWQRGNSLANENDGLRARVDLSKTIDAENKRLADLKTRVKEMEEREKTLYPKIEEMKKESGRLWAKIQKRLKELEDLNRPQITGEVEGMEINEKAAEFDRLGYPCKVVKEPK